MPKYIERKTDIHYRNLKSKDKPYKEYDGDGLLMTIRPNGRKVWQYNYTFANKRGTKTLGYYQPDRKPVHMSASDARKLSAAEEKVADEKQRTDALYQAVFDADDTFDLALAFFENFTIFDNAHHHAPGWKGCVMRHAHLFPWPIESKDLKVTASRQSPK